MNPLARLKAKRRKLVKDLGGKALWTLERLIAHASLVGNPPLFDPDRFDWVHPLEANWHVIRHELEAVLEQPEAIPNFQDISTDQAVLTTDDRWKTYFLYGMGYKAVRNCARCPETTRLIEQVPGMTTAFFSILAPHKHIPAHRGLYKGFLRCHLGLVVPAPREACRLRVAEQVVHWEEGKSIVFDDTYEHEVWNETDGVRVVLFLDVVRPLRFPVDLLNGLLIAGVRRSGYVQDARRNQEQWDQRLQRVPA
jgi:aspartyl/asparaginyl beta-hydroxylase (cupin superfamily)